MKNLLTLVGLAVVSFAGAGWYLGWYTLGTEPSSAGHRKINVDVNTGKIREDLKSGREKITDVLSRDQAPGVTVPAPVIPSDGPTAGVQLSPDGTATIQLPKLPPLPTFSIPTQVDVGGAKIVLPQPPPPPQFIP